MIFYQERRQETEMKSPIQIKSGRFTAPPLFLGVTFHDLTAFHHDFLEGGPSTLHSIQDFHRTGHPPLWISTQGMGSPYLGLYLPALAHPLIFGLFRFSLGASSALVSFINTELVAVFGFLLFRRCGASAWGSAAAGFLLCLSGFVPWVTLIYPIAFPIPWMLCWIWSAMGLSEKVLFRRWVWNAISVVMILLCGDVQIVVQDAYLLVAWYLLWAWRTKIPLPRFVRCLALLLVAAGIGWVLALYQLLPAILCFSRTITVRTPTLFDYASTFPHAPDIILAGLGLFSRLYRNLFLPFSCVLLIAIAFVRRRENPAFQVSIILAIIVFILVAGGRSGLATVPFHLPMLKSFVRHYKLALILQGPVFIGVALGFDALIQALRARNRPWLISSFICLALTLYVLPDHLWRAVLIGGLGGLWLTFKYHRRFSWTPALLFGLLAADIGSYAWQTPYRLYLPTPDPIYLEYVEKLGPKARVQGIYPWVARVGHHVNQPLPVHGHGYFGEHSIDLWLNFPLKNHAYFLAAMVPGHARIRDGVFQSLDFSTPFKSTDFVTVENRHLVNLAGIRYFFLQDMALSETDRLPILSDPEYMANPARPRAFEPWSRVLTGEGGIPGENEAGRPALLAEKFGSFSYQRVFDPDDTIAAQVKWEKKGGSPGKERTAGSGWPIVIYNNEEKVQLLFSRAILSDRAGEARIEEGLEVSEPMKGEIVFGLAPVGIVLASDPPALSFPDPQIQNSEKTIRYLAGDRVMVFENEQSFGRARVVHRGRHIQSNGEALEVMKDPDMYDPGVEALLMDADAPAFDGPDPTATERPELVSYRDDEAVLKARLDRPGWLVLADTYYPGWRAFGKDGRELRIYRADMTLRAVALQEGGHAVTFRYLPEDFRIGLYASLASVVSLAALGTAVGFRKRLTL
jgi:hypothetical protein